MAGLHLEVVTPKGVIVREDVDEVTVPGTLGEFGILEGHIPVLSALRAGVLTYKTGGQSEALALGGRGYVEIGAGERVMVLSDLGMKRADVDADGARQELAEAKSQLERWSGQTDDAEHAALQQKADWAEARLALL